MNASRDYLRITVDGSGIVSCVTDNLDVSAYGVLTIGSAFSDTRA